MKISKSKQELARIISENGGWGSDKFFAAQDACGVVNIYERKPVFSAGCSGFGHGGGWFTMTFKAKKIKNWHQTILSREEYFHLYPAPDADGWIEWHGGECPVDEGVNVDLKWSDGFEPKAAKPRSFRWQHLDSHANIIAYRLHKPEQSTVESRLADAVEIVKSATPVLMRDGMKFTGDEVMGERKPTIEQHISESYHKGVYPVFSATDGHFVGCTRDYSTPTIEQLAADYRNAKDYADRKQQEADDAKADADAKLAELVAAGKALSLVISVAEQEPELVITDYHQLYIGDILRCKSAPCGAKCRVGDEGVLKRTENDPLAGGVYVEVCGKDWFGVFGEHWEFIRRP